MSEKKYYKPALPLSLKEDINRLFVEFPSLKDQYDNNPSDFVRECVRLRLQEIRNSRKIDVDFKKTLVDEILDRLKD